jgi:hypothetical protein
MVLVSNFQKEITNMDRQRQPGEEALGALLSQLFSGINRQIAASDASQEIECTYSGDAHLPHCAGHVRDHIHKLVDSFVAKEIDSLPTENLSAEVQAEIDQAKAAFDSVKNGASAAYESLKRAAGLHTERQKRAEEESARPQEQIQRQQNDDKLLERHD